MGFPIIQNMRIFRMEEFTTAHNKILLYDVYFPFSSIYVNFPSKYGQAKAIASLLVFVFHAILSL